MIEKQEGKEEGPVQGKIYQHQVGGVTLIFCSPDNRLLYKKVIKPLQPQFYRYMGSLAIGHPHRPLLAHMPKYYRLVLLKLAADQQPSDESMNRSQLEWINSLKSNHRNKDNDVQLDDTLFMEMENFTSAYRRLNFIDVKLGYLRSKTLNPLFKRINLQFCGVRKTYPDGSVEFCSKRDPGLSSSVEAVNRIFAYFFTNGDPLRLQKELIESLLNKLFDIALIIRCFRGWTLHSVSICMAYDAEDLSKWDVRIIDFGRAQLNGLRDDYDRDFVKGLDYLIACLRETIANSQYYESNLLSYEKDILANKEPAKLISEVQTNRQTTSTVQSIQ